MLRKLAVIFVASASVSAADVAQLAWLAGCWATAQNGVIIEERWTPPVGGQMIGVSRTIRAATVVFNEFIRIDTTPDGIYYSPRIGTPAAAVRFKLTKQSDTEVIFENPEHDFPQRVLYTKTATGVTARVDGVEQAGKNKGRARAEDYPMREIPCK